MLELRKNKFDYLSAFCQVICIISVVNLFLDFIASFIAGTVNSSFIMVDIIIGGLSYSLHEYAEKRVTKSSEKPEELSQVNP